MISGKVHLQVQNRLLSMTVFENSLEKNDIDGLSVSRKKKKYFQLIFLCHPIQISLTSLLRFSKKHFNRGMVIQAQKVFFLIGPLFSAEGWSLYYNDFWRWILLLYFLKNWCFWLFFWTDYYVKLPPNRLFATNISQKHNPVFLITQRWFLKASEMSICKEMLGENSGIIFHQKLLFTFWVEILMKNKKNTVFLVLSIPRLSWFGTPSWIFRPFFVC